MKKYLIIAAIITSIVFMIFISKTSNTNTDEISQFTTVKQGTFEILVVSTGELQAENFSEILAPEGLKSRRLRINGNITISDLVTEGTVVEKGDYVATLDRTELDNTLKTEYDNLSTMEASFEMSKLDSAVTLSSLRDNIKNTTLNVEEAKITLTQSKYEPPSTIRQAEISLDKIERSLDQLKRSYDLRVRQAESTLRNLNSRLDDQTQKVYELEQLLSEFIITAPSPGMIIYMKDRTGNKRKSGSAITTQDRVVATLPDMSTMVSKTYVNEIDIDKINIGMDVRIVLDAFVGKEFTGKISYISNVGEQMPSASAKVFEVLIRLNESDPALRPAMTTGNMIIINSFENVSSVPLMAIQTDENNKQFVYTKDKKKINVELGEINENAVIINGIDAGIEIYLNQP